MAAALQCARPLALWQQQQHFPGKRCSIGNQCRRRSVALSFRHSSIHKSSAKCRLWRAMASDSQAQDEEEKEGILFSEEEGERIEEGEEGIENDDDEEEDDEDNVDVDVLSNEEIDALMKEYGNVVRSDLEPRKSSADDASADTEALAMATAFAKVANEVKAVDIKVLHVKPLIYWARYFIIASAFSMPQVNAIVGRIEDVAEEQYKIRARASGKPSAWTLMDFGDVVVHIFLPSQREFYNLEEFYANAPVVELPFVSENSSNREVEEEENEEEMVSMS